MGLLAAWLGRVLEELMREREDLASYVTGQGVWHMYDLRTSVLVPWGYPKSYREKWTVETPNNRHAWDPAFCPL